MSYINSYMENQSNSTYHLRRNVFICHVILSFFCYYFLIGVGGYKGKENVEFLSSILYLIYKWFIGVVFRLGPTVLLAYLNLRIIIAYRRTCKKRRIMTGKFIYFSIQMYSQYANLGSTNWQVSVVRKEEGQKPRGILFLQELLSSSKK